MKDIFTSEVTAELIDRINKIDEHKAPQWGKMRAAQMLAHCNVAYEMYYEKERFKQPGAIKRFLLKSFLKSAVVGPKPYKKNSPTAPEFLVKTDKDFQTEKNKLIAFLQRAQADGRAHFEGAESLSFGSMTADEWNGLYYKHLDHHLTQFGV